MNATCRHCRERTAYKARGLCGPCYRDHREEYDRLTPASYSPDDEPTEAELNAMIEAHRPTMPADRDDTWARGAPLRFGRAVKPVPVLMRRVDRKRVR